MKINLEVDSDHCPVDSVRCGTASQGSPCVQITLLSSGLCRIFNRMRN
jgi:hypothetical protein